MILHFIHCPCGDKLKFEPRMSNKMIATKMKLSRHTVDGYQRTLFGKLGGPQPRGRRGPHHEGPVDVSHQVRMVAK